MRRVITFISLIFISVLTSCSSSRKSGSGKETHSGDLKSTVKLTRKVKAVTIHTRDVSASALVDFAETLKGIKYKYGSTNKEQGFDCSGFVWYVFNQFGIKVPRSSVDFTNAGEEVKPGAARRGDIILFTGSDATSGVVGHMGFVTTNRNGDLRFIHSASGGGKGVMISPMSSYFITRFVKVIRVFSVE